MSRLGRVSERLLVPIALVLLVLTLIAPWVWRGTARRVSARPTLASPRGNTDAHGRSHRKSVLVAPTIHDSPLAGSPRVVSPVEPPVASHVELVPPGRIQVPKLDETDRDDSHTRQPTALFLPEIFPPAIDPSNDFPESPNESPRGEFPQYEPRLVEEPTLPEMPDPVPTEPEPEVAPEPVDPIAQRRGLAVSPWTWPQSIVEQTQAMEQLPGGTAWRRRLDATLVELVQAQGVNVPTVLERLSRLADEARQAGDRTSSYPDRAAWLRASFAVSRRIKVWKAGLNTLANSDSLAKPDVAAAELETIRQHLAAIPGGDRWSIYLGLDAVAAAIPSRNPNTIGQAWRSVAKRISPDKLNGSQGKFLASPTMAPFAARVRAFAEAEQRVAEVFAAIESVEYRENAVDARRLARLIRGEYQLAGFHPQSAAELPTELTTYYRNANFRVAVGQSFIERFLPQPEPTRQDVVDEIRGAQVTGAGTASTRLSLTLMPDAERWRLAICGTGTVQTETLSTKGPFQLTNDGFGQFSTHKFIVIDRRGMQVTRAAARANSTANLRDLETSFDSIPLIGSVARAIAKSQYEQEKVEAQGEMDAKMAARIGNQFEGEVNSRLADFEQRFEKQWIKFFEDMGLAPRPMELETTDQRLIARWRFAGSEQLSGHTPRPQAPGDSLISIQVHQSFGNNLLQGLNLNGRRATIPELYRDLAARFQFKQAELSEEIPEDLVLHFADDEPARIDFIDGRARISLKLKELTMGEEDSWKNFTVRAWYKPADNQEEANLVRDGVVELVTERMGIGDQVPLRGIFSKVFSKNRPINVLNKQLEQRPKLADLQVTQLDMIDGWCGIALGPKRPGGVSARRPLHTSTRK